MTRNPRKLSLALLAVLALVVGSVSLMAQATQSGDQSQTDSSAAKKTAKPKTDASSKDATASASASSSSSTSTSRTPASSPSSSKTATSATSAKPQTPPPNSSGMVWVNTDSGVYHKPGTRWYGKTKQGKYMLEADAIKAGYKAAK